MKILYMINNKIDYPSGIIGHSLSWQNRRELHPNANKVFSSKLWHIPECSDNDQEHIGSTIERQYLVTSSPTQIDITKEEEKKSQISSNNKITSQNLKYGNNHHHIHYTEPTGYSDSEDDEDDDDIVEDGVINYDEVLKTPR